MTKEQALKLYDNEIKRECIQELKDYFAEEDKMRRTKQTDFDVEGYDGFIRRVVQFERDCIDN